MYEKENMTAAQNIRGPYAAPSQRTHVILSCTFSCWALMFAVMILILKIHMGLKSEEPELLHYSFIIVPLVCFQ